MRAPPGESGNVTPTPAASSASEDTTAIAGNPSVSDALASETVAANDTSWPNPISVCASPSSRATSSPTRITFATMHYPRTHCAGNFARRTDSHQPEQHGLDDVQQEVGEDGSDVESTHGRDDTPQRHKDRLAECITPPHPPGIRRNREPGADYPHYQRDLEDAERPAHQKMEDAGRSALRSEHRPDDLCPNHVQEGEQQNPPDDHHSERPEGSRSRSTAGPHHFPLDRRDERIHRRATEARDGVERTDLYGANRPVESADRAEHERYPQQHRAQYLYGCVRPREERFHYCSAGFMCSSRTRNANLSAASSICLVVGLPAPWPAFVWMRTRIGLGQP